MHKMDPTNLEELMVYSVVGIALLALLYAGWLARQILSYSKGSEEMQVVWRDIKAGANAYLRTQLRTISVAIALLTVALFLSVYVVEPTKEADELFGDNARTVVAFARAIAFLMGASFSAMVGFIGMNMAVEGNVRVAEAANSYPDDEDKSYNEALKVAYRSGTITGMLTDGLGLLGGTSLFIIFGKASPDVLLGFGFGGTLLAMFMRVGGGIYTKAADVGADLVGKVEAGMEEDDPRNAAVIADLVGDNVGDCAGMAADIFESYEVTIVSSLILGLALADLTGELHFIVLPLLIRGVGVISSIVGTYAVSMWRDAKDAEDAMYKSYELSSAITIFSSLFLAWQYAEDLRVGVLVAVGVALAVAFNPLTAYATSANSKRVQKVAAGTRFGPALVILEGVSLGYLSSVWAVSVIVAALAASILIYSAELASDLGQLALIASLVLAAGAFFYFYNQKKLMNGIFAAMWLFVGGMFLYSMEEVPDADSFSYVLFGVSLIGVGMLSHTGNNVSMDTFGPISDNANGIGEVAGMEGQARQIMADLDAAGNTTKAITKGVAIGSAVIAALSLYGAFFTDIQRVQTKEPSEEFVAVIDDLESYYDSSNEQLVAALNLSWVEDNNNERDDRLAEVVAGDEEAIAAVQEEEEYTAAYSRIREHVEEEVWPRGRETYVNFKDAWLLVAPDEPDARDEFDEIIFSLDEVWNEERSIFEKVINLSDATVFTGLLLGAMLPLLFGGLLIKAVNRSAAEIMAEVRRQLRIPAIWEGKERPDYTRAVEISTRSAQAELIPLGVIAVLSPIVVGILLKEEALGGFLAGVIASGVLQAVFMANSGGAWDNAKKYVEDGHFGGKGSENHKASVVGDTVGDPFKDTAGPALNPMIKVINLVGLIVAPIVVENEGYPIGAVIGAVVCMVAILWAVQRSDREDDLLADEAGTEALTEAEVSSD